MKYLRLSVKLIYSQISLHIILVLQLIAALLVSGAVLSTLSLVGNSYSIMKPTLESNYCYFSKATRRHLLTESEGGFVQYYDEPSMEEIEQKLTGVKKICNNRQIQVRQKSGRPNTDPFIFDIVVQEKEIINKTRVAMLKGNWLDNAPKEYGMIRVVTNHTGYSIGEIVDGEISAKGKRTSVKLKIVGIAGNPFGYIGTSGGGMELCSSNIVDYNDRLHFEREVRFGIACVEDFDPAFLTESGDSGGCSIYFNDYVTEDEMRKNYSVLGSYGFVNTAQNIVESDTEVTKYTLKNNLPDIVFLLSVSLIGLGVVSTINISKNMNILSIFCISGCSRKQLYLIIFFYILIVSGSALLPVYIIYLISPYNKLLSSFFIMISVYSFIVPLFIVAIFALVSFLFPYSVLRKNSIYQTKLNYYN